MDFYAYSRVHAKTRAHARSHRHHPERCAKIHLSGWCPFQKDSLSYSKYFLGTSMMIAIAPSKNPAPRRPKGPSSSRKRIHASTAAVRGSHMVTILATVADSEGMPT